MRGYTYRKIPTLHIQSCCQTAPQAHTALRESWGFLGHRTNNKGGHYRL